MLKKSNLIPIAISLSGCWDMRLSTTLETGNGVYSKSEQTHEEQFDPKMVAGGFWQGITGLANSPGLSALGGIIGTPGTGIPSIPSIPLPIPTPVLPGAEFDPRN